MMEAQDVVYPDWINKASSLAYPILGKLMGWSLSHIKKVILESYSITEQESERIVNISQRTPGWFKVRNGWVDVEKQIFRGSLVSSSVVGKILGHEGNYGPPDLYEDGTESLYGMLFRTQRGTAAEPLTQQEFLIVLRAHLGPTVVLSADGGDEVGIKINPDLPYCGASIDSKLHMLDTRTLEYTTAGLEMKARGTIDAQPPQWIPKNYYDQLAISMFIYKWQQYWFVFHSNATFSVESYEFDEAQWYRNLEIVDAWYWGNYWPTLVLAHSKKLQFGANDAFGFQLTFSDERKDAEMVFGWAKKNELIDYLWLCTGAPKMPQ